MHLPTLASSPSSPDPSATNPRLLLAGLPSATSHQITRILGSRFVKYHVVRLTSLDGRNEVSVDLPPSLIVISAKLFATDPCGVADFQSEYPSSPVLLLTNDRDDTLKERAFAFGINEFLSEPFSDIDFLARVTALLHRSTAVVTPNESEPCQCAQLRESRQDLLLALARTGEYRNQDSVLHLLRVGRYVGVIAEHLGFDPHQVELLEQAALLHDVGKIGIPELILLKPSELTKHEYERIQTHCAIGRDLILSSLNPNLRVLGCFRGRDTDVTSNSALITVAANIAYSHHERWDGAGYPEGLAGEAIPIEARITAIADVFDALSSARPYKSSFMPSKCMQLIEEECGKHFDPRVVEAFLQCKDKLWSIRQELENTNLQ